MRMSSEKMIRFSLLPEDSKLCETLKETARKCRFFFIGKVLWKRHKRGMIVFQKISVLGQEKRLFPLYFIAVE